MRSLGVRPYSSFFHLPMEAWRLVFASLVNSPPSSIHPLVICMEPNLSYIGSLGRYLASRR